MGVQGSTEAAPGTFLGDASHAAVHIPRRKRTGRMRRVAGETPCQAAAWLLVLCTSSRTQGLAVCMT